MSEVDLQGKRDNISKKLQEREEERLKVANQRREESEKYSSENESTAFYKKTVDSGAQEIRDGLGAAGDQAQNTLAAFFDELSCKLSTLQKFVSDSTMFLTAFDLGQSQNLLKEIQVEISLRRDELMPKKKFAFKNRKKQNASKPSAGDQKPSEPQQPSSSGSVVSYDNSANEYRVDNKNYCVIEINADDVKNKDVIMSKLTNVTIKLKGVPSAMHLTDVKSSIVICGPCARSVFIERCENSTFVLACQQLRIHEAVYSSFHIHVTSKAIIEDSKDLRFAPYKLSYEGIDDHYTESGLSREVNNWDAVDDFNWLVKDKQSPHWTTMGENDQISHTL